MSQVTVEPDFFPLAILEQNGKKASLKDLVRDLSSQLGWSLEECYNLILRLKQNRQLWIVRTLCFRSPFLREVLADDWNKTLVFRYRPDAINYVFELEAKMLAEIRRTKAFNTRGGAIRKVKRFTREILINQLGFHPYELEFLRR